MESLIEVLQRIAPVSKTLQDHLIMILKKKVFKKRSYLLQEGQVSNHIYFLEGGIVRCFYDTDGQEVCIWFMEAGNLVISVESFFIQEKSHQYIQALEDCTVWSISYEELQTMYTRFPEFNLHRAVLLERYYIECERRQRMLSLNSAAERYAYLLQTNPNLILKLPARYVAGYLNIDETYYSRIKARSIG